VLQVTEIRLVGSTVSSFVLSTLGLRPPRYEYSWSNLVYAKEVGRSNLVEFALESPIRDLFCQGLILRAGLAPVLGCTSITIMHRWGECVGKRYWDRGGGLGSRYPRRRRSVFLVAKTSNLFDKLSLLPLPQSASASVTYTPQIAAEPRRTPELKLAV
jgi:hypothetical protein